MQRAGELQPDPAAAAARRRRPRRWLRRAQADGDRGADGDVRAECGGGGRGSRAGDGARGAVERDDDVAQPHAAKRRLRAGRDADDRVGRVEQHAEAERRLDEARRVRRLLGVGLQLGMGLGLGLGSGLGSGLGFRFGLGLRWWSGQSLGSESGLGLG